jgi:hypothetical protein
MRWTRRPRSDTAARRRTCVFPESALTAFPSIHDCRDLFVVEATSQVALPTIQSRRLARAARFLRWALSVSGASERGALV